MDTQELNALYVALLETLQQNAPWVAEQVEQTVREGKPVARQVRRSKGGAETVALVVASSKLRDDQFAATEELTANERALVALDAVERLLVDPPAIDRAMRQTMAQVKVDGVLFAEPTTGPDVSIKPLPLTFTERERLADLVDSREGRGARCQIGTTCSLRFSPCLPLEARMLSAPQISMIFTKPML